MPLVKKCRHGRGLSSAARLRAWEVCGCTWLADVRVAGQRSYIRLGPHLVEARREYRALVQRLEHGEVPRPPASDRAFDALARRWLRQHSNRVGPNTAHGYRTALAHSTRWLGDTDVAAITAATLAEMESDLLAAGLSPSYVRQVRIVTGMVLGYGVDHGLIDEAPSMRRHRLQTRRREPRFLQPAEVEAVLVTLADPYRAMTEFAWLTGLRPGEVVALEGRDVVGGHVEVSRTVHSRTGLVGPTKSRQTRRVDLSDRAAALVPRVDPAARLWPRSYTQWLRHFHDALDRARIDRCGLHALRHSNVALRLAAAQDLVYIADQLGHSTAAFTLKVYGHLLRRPESQAHALDVTAAQLASSPAPAEGDAPPGAPSGEGS